jgi:hypothetical protein
MTATGGSMTAQGRLAALAVAIAMIGTVGGANAYVEPGAVDMKVVDRETGRPLRVWRHDGRLFVAGQPGARYSLRVSNHTDGRVLVVMSVDGVNILTGETASYDQRGYVFQPHQSYDVSGWRKSNTEVAAFTFAPLPQSYAARTGRPEDVGVIGMAVFTEQVAAPPPISETPWLNGWNGARPSDAAGAARRAAMPAPPPTTQPAPSGMARSMASAAPPEPQDEKLGTGHGAREWSVADVVPFERATPYPERVSQIEYDTYANLVARGVIPAWRDGEHRPRPFPSDPDGAGYVPDPPPQP